jgi:steroid delta-isomerase-like uncharacterized protein
MAGSDNVAALRTFFGHVDRQEWDAAMQAFADDFVLHMSGNPQPMTVQEFADFGKMFSAAMPDLTHSIDAVVVDGDDVASRLNVTGTHLHELMGVPGSGRAVSVSSFNFYRFRDGKIVEQWINFDALGLMQQIGALPAAAAA